jgi:acyl-CoA reductase-like NAD-dependent aldehyde dehydrogenase
MRVAQEEIWGPVASILVVDSMEEGIHVVNDSDYGLTASIYTEDLNRALRMLHEVQAAAVVFNAPGVDIDVPWSLGGDRDSAYGRAGDTLDVFTEPRTVVFDYRSKRDEAGFGA